MTVEDDGAGFSNIEDAYTLMGHTAKRGDPEKRGRFNLGEKEVLSVARYAEIETVGRTIVFPAEGGRKTRKNKRTRGTKITAVMPWRHDQIEPTLSALRRFRTPSNCALVVNGDPVPQRHEIATARGMLATVNFNDDEGMMEQTYRVTDVHVLERLGAGDGWLYEMGVPVQQIDIAYDVDVQQKIPMPPNRDTVSSYYLSTLAAHVLNVVADQLEPDAAAEGWVASALASHHVSEPAARTTIERRYGPKVAMWSSNTDANLQAAEAGYEVLHPRSMSSGERTNLKDKGGIVSTNALFGKPKSGQLPVPAETTHVHSAFALWVRELGAACGLTVSVAFIRNAVPVVADCTADSSSPTIRFNTFILEPEFFDGRGAYQIEVIVHEFGHALAERALEHGPAWGNACCRAAGRILEHLEAQALA